jgi:hypothetical protein
MYACASDAPTTDEEHVSGGSTTSMQEWWNPHFPTHDHVLGTIPGSEGEKANGSGTMMEEQWWAHRRRWQEVENRTPRPTLIVERQALTQRVISVSSVHYAPVMGRAHQKSVSGRGPLQAEEWGGVRCVKVGLAMVTETGSEPEG